MTGRLMAAHFPLSLALQNSEDLSTLNPVGGKFFWNDYGARQFSVMSGIPH